RIRGFAMKFKKSLTLLLSSILTVGILAACSSGETSNSSEGTETNGGKTVIKIATQSPLSGGSSVIGDAIKSGAQMKLDEEKAKFEEMGFVLQLEPYDDQGDPKKGVSNANVIGADESIYGVIGHYNSGV